MPTPGGTTDRGYGHTHQRTRTAWAPHVDNGEVDCHAITCLNPYGTGRWIPPGTPWDLGHTEDRTAYTGPEHRKCNRTDGAVRRNAGRTPRTTVPGLPTTGDWWA